MSTAADDDAVCGFPRWVLLEQFVFRRDDDDSFPDDTKAPIRASGTTSWGADFRIAFSLAEPPRISRLYAQLPVPGFLDRFSSTPLAILGTHHHLILFRLATKMRTTVQNFFVYSAKANPSSSSLKALPPCTEPEFDYSRSDGCLSRHPLPWDSSPRLLTVESMGLWCNPKEEEFVVAELTLFAPMTAMRRPDKIFADICLLRSSTSSANGQLVGGTWNSMRVEIHDLWQLSGWETDIVIPFRQWLCWTDYNEGILFCDMSKVPTPTVSFLRFPLHDLPSYANFFTGNHHSFLYRGVSIVDRDHTLKFVNVNRHDDLAFGALKPGTGFTVTCHTLVLSTDGSIAWEEDYAVTSDELWEANSPELLPRDVVLMFPQVDMNRPHVVYFLFAEFEYVNKKMWVVSIDMSTKTVESFSPYINGMGGPSN